MESVHMIHEHKSIKRLISMGWFYLVCLLFIFLSSPLLIFSNEDRLTLGVSISGNQTMISAGGSFALGFFSPENSTNQYLGIWYNKIAPQTIVWVANREVPLMNNSTGTFMLSDEGNLVVFHGSRKNVIWSSNVSLAVVTGNNSVGLLTDKGNLILTDIEEGNVLWESFNYPSDTILPGMKFGLNLINGHNDRLISWNKVDDPAAGVFSFTIDPRGPVQMLIWKTSDIYARTKPWNGSYTLTYSDNAHNYATIATFNVTDEGYYFGFSVTDESLILRFMLDRDGKMKLLAWLNTKKWLLVWSFPTVECELYDRCGPSGLCDNTTSICGCLKGFRPFSQKDWEMGNHSAGCVREDGQICDNRDGFKSFKKIKLPDNSISLPGNLSHRECENQCLRNCSCTAYVYANTGSGFTSSCLNWNGELMDLSTFDTEERDVYFRLPGAELFGSGKIHKTTHTFTIAATTVAVGILLIGAAACYVLWRWMGRREEANTSEINRIVYKTPRSPNKDAELFSFSLNSILAATNHFSMANKLGEGGFGSVFKGKLPDGEEIAIKRLSKMSGQGIEELMNELTLISKLQHMNLVRLVGCCIEGEEKMLIYEYMPNKSLDTFLFDPTKQVTFEWTERFHIIEGVAQGILYLHKYSRVKIIHRDLKASNILLDGAMNPKISDFGMARIFGGNQSQANTQRVVGTYGYMSPEYALNGRFSEKSDVYSFGVLLIEIVTGKKNSGFYPSEDSMSLLVYAWQLWKEDRVAELMDASIRHSLISLDEVAKCIHIGLLCVQENANHRPTMSSVVSMLANETLALPAPQAPTFFTRICMTTVVASSSSNYSINEVSVTDVHAR